MKDLRKVWVCRLYFHGQTPKKRRVEVVGPPLYTRHFTRRGLHEYPTGESPVTEDGLIDRITSQRNPRDYEKKEPLSTTLQSNIYRPEEKVHRHPVSIHVYLEKWNATKSVVHPKYLSPVKTCHQFSSET